MPGTYAVSDLGGVTMPSGHLRMIVVGGIGIDLGRSLLPQNHRFGMIDLMDPDDPIDLSPIGIVESSLADPHDAPRQPDEGAPPATVVVDELFAAGLEGIAPGDWLVLVTWLDRGQRDVLSVHPRGDLTRPVQGVFLTRSADRPNPIGLHRVEVAAIDGARLKVAGLEAIDGTPILDIKPVLSDRVGGR